MKEIQVFNFEQNEVRTLQVNNQPYFVLADVCKVLDLKNPTMVARKLDDDERAKSDLGLQERNVTLINESGLYAVILRSDKPQAKQFRKWITAEVLPTLRKTGTYTVKKTAEDKARMLATREENIKVRKAQLLFRVSEKCGVESYKGNNLTSYTNTFDVEYSALPELPSSATESELEQILNLLEAYAAVNPGIVEKLENFQIGTITAQAGEPGTQPRVTAEIVNKSLPNGYDLNMNFTLPTGEPAGFNRVTAEAETISAGSFAEADVTTSGPNTSKNFAFKFKIPKGDKGTSGQDGLDGAGVFALKQVYDSTTTKIPASDVEIPTYSKRQTLKLILIMNC